MIYLIHFDNPFHHARHYIGFCEDGNIDSRLARHKAGNGSRLIRALNKAGIDYSIVRIWPDGDRNMERKLKNQKNSKRFCPVCREESKHESN
jgi:hypothetical protein